MGYILPSYSNKVRYTLRDSLGDLEISEPRNWNEDEKEFKRSTKAHGVFINLSNNLEFYRGDSLNNGGYDRLLQIYDLEGINAQVLLIKEEEVSGIWEESYRGYLDFSTFTRQNNIAKIKFNESGLYEQIKARQSEKVELDRETSIDGEPISSLDYDGVAIDGRDVIIVSALKRTSGSGTLVIADSNSIFLDEETSTINFNHDTRGRYEAVCMPLTMVAERTGNVQTVYDYVLQENGVAYQNGRTTGNMFYSIADDDIDLIFDFDIELKVFGNKLPDVLKLDLVKFSGGLNYIYESFESLIEVENPSANQTITFQKGKVKVELNTGESLALMLHSEKVNEDGIVQVLINKSDIVIYDETFYEGSTSKMLMAHEVLDRTLEIITGESGKLKSNALGRTDILDTNGLPKYESDGVDSGAFTGMTNGFWLRGFDDEKLTTSFKEYFESFGATWQLGYGIERSGFRESLRAEKWDYFYQDIPTINIGQPKDIKRTVAKDYFFSSFEVGYDKPSGEVLYEESMGLDEYNIKATYTTPITRVENRFKQTSKYRADSYGMEFARRKPITSFPADDTRYDKDVFILDVKRDEEGGSNYLQRKWKDDFVVSSDFSKLGVGVYSPETATNLRFSPLNCLLRWGFWVRGGLDKYKTDYIRYSSTDGNSTLKTELKDSGKEYAENGEILISDLEKSLFVPEYIEFEYPVDSELLRTINGNTRLSDGTKIKNYYGLVEFENEDGLLEWGYLMELKPNKQGSWKLLRANKKPRLKREVPPTAPVTNIQGFDYKNNLIMVGSKEAESFDYELDSDIEA